MCRCNKGIYTVYLLDGEIPKRERVHTPSSTSRVAHHITYFLQMFTLNCLPRDYILLLEGARPNIPSIRNKFTLWYSRVLLAGFVHLDGVILQVEENDTVANTVLLFSLFMHCLLEVGIEPQHLGGKDNAETSFRREHQSISLFTQDSVCTYVM